MRGLVILFVIGVVGSVATVLILKKTTDETTIAITMGFGEGKDNQIEMNSVVGFIHKEREAPRSDPVSGTIYWDDWVDEHFQLFDSGRQSVPLMRVSNSSIIPDRKAGSMVEFYLSAKLTPGEEYVYEYIPVKSENRKFRHIFIAPSAKETCRPNFELVE